MCPYPLYTSSAQADLLLLQYRCHLEPIIWVKGQCCYRQWVAEQRSKDRLHERRRLKNKRVLERTRRASDFAPRARQGQHEKTSTLRLVSEVWVNSHAKRALYSRNASFKVQSHWLTKTGQSTCEAGGHC